MSHVDQLKDFGTAHAHSQRIPQPTYRAVCRRIVSDDGDAPGSWVAEWIAEGDRHRVRGETLQAASRYNLARFPYLDGPARTRAHTLALGSCAEWASGQDGLERLDVPYDGDVVRCWAGGLSASRPLPLLVVMGGIVTTKEQWVPLLPRLAKMGLAGLVAEMPAVGENPAPYTPQSWRMIPALLDAVEGRVAGDGAYALAQSFSGHLALRTAAHDRRLRGIVTTGAPVSHTFRGGVEGLPPLTVATLAHLTGVGTGRLSAHLADGWAVPDEELDALDVPVRYVCSLRDEVIPRDEVALLREHVRDLRVLEYDEGHAAPRYAAETRTWVMHAIAAMTGASPVQRAALATVWRLLRARRGLSERRDRRAVPRPIRSR